MSDMEKLVQKEADIDAFDSEAYDEMDKLEQELAREQAAQVRQRKEHRRATEVREN